MKKTVLLLVLLAACGGDDTNGGSADANNDIDFDGVPDVDDNCPQSANGFQHNEDGDRFGDACDPCPPIADDNPPNGESDAVADACDPKPILLGDEVAKFEGFHQGKPSGWDEAGTWGGANGALTANNTGAGHFSLIQTDRTRETLSAEITVVSTTGSSEIGLVDNKEPMGPSGVACVITSAPAVSVYQTTNMAGAVSTAFELAANATYLVTLTRENSTYTCTAKNVATNATATATQMISLANTPYQSGMVVNAASVRVKWFMLITSQ